MGRHDLISNLQQQNFARQSQHKARGLVLAIYTFFILRIEIFPQKIEDNYSAKVILYKNTREKGGIIQTIQVQFKFI